MTATENKTCIILGLGSDIAQELRKRLLTDGWTVTGASRTQPEFTVVEWDLLIVAMGTLEPIGRFAECDPLEWENAVMVNALAPLRGFRQLLPLAKHGATAIFFGGTNPTSTPTTYSAYAASKALLREAAKIIDDEEDDLNVHILDPGVVKTKIHDATLKAGKRADNYDRVFRIVNGEEATVSHDRVYAKLKALI